MEDTRLLLHRGLVQVSGKMGRILKPHLERFNLSGPEYGILRNLGGESLTLSELSQRLLRVNSNITALIDNLETRGLVQRVRDEQDRRIIRVRLTEVGQKLRNDAVATQNSQIMALLAGMSDAEIDELRRLLAKVEEICDTAM